MNEQLLDEARKLIVGFFVNRRKELGLTQQDVADKAGLSLRTVKGFELMQFWPGLKQYLSLCHALDLYFFVEEKEGSGPYAKTMRERWQRKSDKN